MPITLPSVPPPQLGIVPHLPSEGELGKGAAVQTSAKSVESEKAAQPLLAFIPPPQPAAELPNKKEEGPRVEEDSARHQLRHRTTVDYKVSGNPASRLPGARFVPSP